MECPNCGAGQSALVPVWEEPEEHPDGTPDHIGCLECGEMSENTE